MKHIIVTAALAIPMLTASYAQDQHAERNKAVVRKVFTDILSQGKYDVAAEIYARDFVNHDTAKDLGADEDLANNRGWRAAFLRTSKSPSTGKSPRVTS